MKLGSIIGLIIASVLVVAGIAFCIIGSVSADNNGYSLFPETTDNGTTYTVNLSDEELSRIKLSLNDATVNLYGNSPENKIEFINYNPNLYQINNTNKVFIFEEIDDFVSSLKIWENGFTFKGLRYLLNFKSYVGDADKTVNIYLSNTVPLGSVDLNLNDGEVTVTNLNYNGSLSVKNNNGNISVNKSDISKKVYLDNNTGNIVIDSLITDNIQISSVSSNISVNSSDISNSSVNLKNGRIDYYDDGTSSNQKIDVMSDLGGILINGNSVKNAYSSLPENFKESIIIITENAGINLVFKEDYNDNQ